MYNDNTCRWQCDGLVTIFHFQKDNDSEYSEALEDSLKFFFFLTSIIFHILENVKKIVIYIGIFIAKFERVILFKIFSKLFIIF